MNIENYFEQEKGITVDAARNAGARYTAIDICRFAKKYHESEVKNLSSNTMLEDRLPNAEDVKRWYQLLVGKSEIEMQKDIEATLR